MRGKKVIFLLKTSTNLESEDEVCNFIKKETLAQAFSCEFCDISKNTIFHRTPREAASANYVRPLKFFQLFFIYWQLQSFMKTFVGYIFAIFYEKYVRVKLTGLFFLCSEAVSRMCSINAAFFKTPQKSLY